MNEATVSNANFTTLGLQPSFGFGDRIGLATPGHVEAMKLAGGGLAPIFAQQSIREMTRTGRSPEQVIATAVEGMRSAGWRAISGADADHLKTCADVDATAAAGFVFYTIDPSEYVDANADDYDAAVLRERFNNVRPRVEWSDHYVNRRVPLSKGRAFTIDEAASMRCAVKYGLAIEHAIGLAKHIGHASGAVERKAEIELSIDETPQPTTLAEHYIIVDQCRQRGVELISLAPRFIGDFEKGVDYKGDAAALERSLSDHAALALTLGPYKLSLHSGSDKLSLYPILSRATNGCFHVKTAGTSYLEALRVAARHNASLFRQVVDAARLHYDRDRATYHVSAEVSKLPAAADCSMAVLEEVYLGRWKTVPTGRGFTSPGRQVLHCTFGTILQDNDLGSRLREMLHEYADAYTEVLVDHFCRHLEALTSAL